MKKYWENTYCIV